MGIEKDWNIDHLIIDRIRQERQNEIEEERRIYLEIPQYEPEITEQENKSEKKPVRVIEIQL